MELTAVLSLLIPLIVTNIWLFALLGKRKKKYEQLQEQHDFWLRESYKAQEALKRLGFFAKPDEKRNK